MTIEPTNVSEGLEPIASDDDLIRRGDAIAVLHRVSEILALDMLDVDCLHRGIDGVPALSPPLPSPGVERLREALEAIDSLCSEEIKARFGGHSHLSVEECGRKSKIYALLVLPRNIARAALSALPLDGGDGTVATHPVDAAPPPA